MRDSILYFFRTYFFWVLTYVIARMFFGLYQFNLTMEMSGFDIIKSFAFGIRHDLSAAGYMLMLNGVLFCFYYLSSWKPLRSLIWVVNIMLLTVCSGVMVGDAELYRNWGSHLDSTPLLYLQTPTEAMASVPALNAVMLFLVFVAFSALFGTLYHKYVYKYFPESTGIEWKSALVSLLLAGSMILPVRGGIGIAPMNSGTVYYHKNLYPNHLAVNACWNFIYSVSKMGKMAPPYQFMKDQKAVSLQENLMKTQHKTTQIIDKKKPNIVLILLESFTAKAVGALGSEFDYTPNLTRIAKEGVLFNNILATSDRSDKGIVGVVSGFPAQPKVSIMKYPQKSQRLPFLTKELKELGYHSSYYYGGETDFANMNSYLTNAEFDKVVDMHQFPSEYYNSKWGVHDHIMFEHVFEDINKENPNTPFFKMFFTLSSHEPFEVPMETMIEGETEEKMFLNSIMYTDKCLGEFFEKAKKQDWYKNTAFILVADHGHRLPGDDGVQNIGKYRIPLIITGGAVTAHDTIVERRGGNTDIAATVLAQLGHDISKFKYSKDLLNPESKSYSFFDYNNGFGFVTDSTKHVVDLHSLNKAYKETKLMKDPYGEAILQNLWNDFLHY